MNIVKIVVIAGIVVSLIVLLSFWLAGAIGILFGTMIAVVVAVRMGGYLGLFIIPPIAKRLTKWVVIMGIASISIIWISGAIGKQLQEFQTKKSFQSPPRAAAVDYPICAGQEIYELRDGKTQIKVPLHPDCWSGWVMLSASTKFMTDTISTGDLEYKFWDGRRVLVKDKTSAWLGDISNSSFRLRGNGEAIITIEKT